MRGFLIAVEEAVAFEEDVEDVAESSWWLVGEDGKSGGSVKEEEEVAESSCDRLPKMLLVFFFSFMV